MEISDTETWSTLTPSMQCFLSRLSTFICTMNELPTPPPQQHMIDLMRMVPPYEKGRASQAAGAPELSKSLMA